MGRLKWSMTLILFFLIVTGGVSLVLAEFNHMIRPAGPVVAFSIESTDPGIYRMEFLGENITAEFPVNKTKEICARVYYFTSAHGSEFLNDSWRVITAAAKKLPPKIYDQVYEALPPVLRETVFPGRAVSN
jgi:hypothetical protein